MKTVHWIAPAITLVIAGWLVGAQRQKISRMENESDVFRKHISAERSRVETGRIAAESERPAKPERVDEEIDWVEIARVLKEVHQGGGVGDMRTMISFKARLQKMDTDQLFAALDQIQALELSDDERMILETLLIGPLVQKDPELLLNRFSDRLNDENTGIGGRLAAAIGEWAKKDQAAAIAWFDREIAAGTFDSRKLDGKSRIRLDFESSLINHLISSDPAAAAARIAALPADHRKDALSGFGFRGLDEEGQVAYADLVRDNLSEKERHEVFGRQASIIAMVGDLDKVDAYLDRIAATGEERIKAAEQAASQKLRGAAHQSKITEENIDSIREWLATQAPGSVDRVTGESLGQIAQFGGSTELSEAAAMVLKYHEKGGSDDLLVGFVKRNYYRAEKDEIRKIAEKISNPVMREQALENLN